ncbi:MAG: ROK family transcriptional regulator [Bifidobacteriaceae bacterium]|jgi:predicted NBD/HSP70 family sugar kinase|nr:ROK family transcriptional regulator [Bifidobacteriaceae bacterium]
MTTETTTSPPARRAAPNPPAPRREAPILSSQRAGELNRSRVIRALYAGGPASRSDLARRFGATRTTIGQIVQPLIDDGLIAEQPAPANGQDGQNGQNGQRRTGKPARPIWFSAHGWQAAAVVLLPDGAQVARVGADGHVFAVRRLAFPPEPAHQHVCHQIAQTITDLAGEPPNALRGIGVTVGGLVDTSAGRILAVKLAPWMNGLEIAPALEQAAAAPAFLDVQPRAQALGDLLFGLGRGLSTFGSIYVGEGIGAAFVINGRLHAGRNGAGGEVGHTAVQIGGPTCVCGLDGCWEALASRRWLRQEAANRGLPDPSGANGQWLADHANCAGARQLRRQYATHLAIGIANLQQTLALQTYIIHGDPTPNGEPLRQLVEQTVRERSYPAPGTTTSILLAEHDDHAALRGAAAIALSHLHHVAF